MTRVEGWKAFARGARLTVATALFAVPAGAYETKVFDLPPNTTAGSVASAPGGKLWFTAQKQGALGVLDPSTGDVQFVPLGNGSTPSGIITDKEGNAWITDPGLNAIVRVNAKTNDVKAFPMPQDLGHFTLNSEAFDHDGVLWFTGLGVNGVYGRLVVATGDVKAWVAPKGRGAQGITVTTDNQVWYVSVASSYIARVDRATGESTIVQTTEPGVEPHIIASDSKGNLWVDEWNNGTLNRYTPKTGQWKSWRVPGEKVPRAFATYIDDKDVAWVIQKVANAVYAFDTKTEKFIGVVPGTKPQANVRRISGRPGEVWLPEAGTGRIVVVKTGGAKAAATAAHTGSNKVVLTSANWTVHQTPDLMTGKRSCTGQRKDDYQVQLTDNVLFINQAKNGGIREYALRFDDEPASANRPASVVERDIQSIALRDDDLAKALASKRIRIQLVTAGGRPSDEDIDVTGIAAAHKAIVGDRDCH